jgi:hypothetical protein
MKELRIVCTDTPSPFPTPPGYCGFVEVEDENGKSINAGSWRKRRDGLWELVVKLQSP